MKSWLIAFSCALHFAVTLSVAHAASLHDEYGLEGQPVKKEWVFELNQTRDARSALSFASEKFRNIPSAKEVSLSFDDKHSDPLGVSSTKPVLGSEQFHKDWIELLFGFKSWKFEEDGGFLSISVHSTSSIPLPAALPLFAGGIGVLYFLMKIRRRKTR